MRKTTILTLAILAASIGALRAGVMVYVPDASFETPVTDYADTNIDNWQDTPQPFWYDPSANGPWAILMGEFANDVPGSSDYIYNMDGNQAAFLFAVPQAGIFQDYNSTDWTGGPPSHDFNSVYNVGDKYQLTVAVLGGGDGGNYGMLPGVTLDLLLYYRDTNDNMVTVGDLTVTNSAEVFTNDNYFIDYTLTVPPALPSSAWAGQNIGIEILSTATFENAAGYWDVDNVRLTRTPTITLLNPQWTGGEFQAQVLSEPGLNIDILSSGDLTTPLSQWNHVTTLHNATGLTSFTDNPGGSQLFYVAHQHRVILAGLPKP